MNRPLIVAALLWGLAAPCAHAAAVGFSLPQGLWLNVDGASALGGSVSVLSTNANVSNVRVGLGLDYSYARQLGAGGQYAFFDVAAGAGLPFAIGPQAYLMPAVDAHALYFVTSPEGLTSPAFGVAPRLTAGFHPAPGISVELSLSHAFVAASRLDSQGGAEGASVPGRSVSIGMSALEIGGTYAF